MRTLSRRGNAAAATLLLLGFGLSPASFAAVSGIVFQDFNSNGLRDAGSISSAADRGLGGVTVTAFDAAGACGTPATTSALPASLGTYTLTTTGCAAGPALRIEFSGYPATLQPSFHGRPSSGATTAAQAGTTVQFAADGTTNLEVALNTPAEFCQNDPLLAIAEQAFGDAQSVNNAAIDSVVRFAYSVTGSTGTPQPVGPVGIAGVPQVGTVYGLAHDRLRDQLYIGAYHKRHAGFGPTGTGAIYRVDAVSTGAPAAPAVFADLNAIFGPGTAGTDSVRGNYEGGVGGDQTWDQVGKSALGDIELDDAGNRLYVVNLADRQLYTLPTSGPLTSGTITRQPIPSPCANAADARPFGLGHRNGILFVSGVCSAQSTGVAANLSAWIYAYDTVAGSFGATPAFQFALNYPRAAGNDDAINDPAGDAIWHAWSSVAGTPAATNNSVYPEPMFSDVVFDGADLVLGFRDRHGDHTGTGNVGTIRGITGGEILRACANGSGGWNIEQDGSCGGVTGAVGTATNQARGPNSVGNTRGGEFYGLEHYSNTTPPFFIIDTPPDYNGRHDENAQGALNQVPGFPQVAITSMDPFRFNTGGLRWYNNATPNNVATTRGYEIFQTGTAGFSKANGLGDLNALCRAAPVEVGNYVWDDRNRNGVMDPGEPPIANVALTLYSTAGTALGATTTDANGEYYFLFNQGATDATTTDNLIVAPNPYASSYTIGVMPANFSAGGPLVNRRPTIANNAGPGTGLLRDSNGVAVTIPGNPATLGAAFTLTGAGSNDHTIDFGFGAVDFGDLPDTGAGTAAGNYATLSADNGASHGIVPGLFLGASVDAEVDGQPNVAANGDDTTGTPDDEDGITLANLSLRTGTPAIVNATATNTTGSAAQLCGFVDFNGDGDFLDAGETAPAISVPNGSTGAPFALNFGTVPQGTASATYARFRLSTAAGACSSVGPTADGEVEDYPVGIASLDFGDLPDAAAGTATGNYNTREADNGASHVIVPGLFMGAGVDAEGDGQPNVAANGDDTALTPDDEDGVTIADLTLSGGGSANIRVAATNTTGTAAKICGFVDFNGDGDFLDAGESATQPVPTGSNNVTFTLNFPLVPLNAAANTYARFRLDNGVGACTPTGSIASGEVEDYPVGIAQLDFGDLPDTGVGTGTGNYATLLADNGPRHVIVPGLFLGAGVDSENNGQPNTGANGDDNAGTPDDEDGVLIADLSLTAGTAAQIRVTATNTALPATPAQLCGFVDFNGDGDFADAGEAAAAISVPNGSNAVQFTLNFGTVPQVAASATYARFRLSTTAGACNSVGAAADGEVEDYPVGITSLDFGDLPDTAAGTATGNYNTLAADNGARHIIVPGLFMGAGVDAEGDGQPNAAANGDDTALTPDDEDGVTIADLSLTGGTSANIRVNATNTTATAAKVCGFVDFNGDGDFLDAGESATQPVPTGSNNVTFTLNFPSVPLNAAASTYARFRLDNSGGACTSTGAIASGEVEDYPVGIAPLDFGDLPDTGVGTGTGNYSTLFADNGARHVIVSGLHMGLGVDSENDGQPNVGANGDDSTGTPDDEDGVQIADLSMTAGLPAQVRVDAVNTAQPPTAAQLCGFVDFNGDGDFADAGETAPAVSVPPGSTAQFTLNFGNVPANAASSTYARFRLSTATGACSASGAAPNGEVEDYPVGIALVDWGDLPDTGAGSGPGNYATTLADGGARHVIVPALYFGAGVDAEADGQPGASANGDDANGTPDDEDGINPADLSLQRGVAPVVNLTATNNTGTTAQVCGYIDTNADGDFADAGETATTTLTTGATNANLQLNFGVVPNTAATTSYARFRISTGACAPNGGALDGEVEDYPVNIGAGILSLGNLVWNDRDNDGTVDPGEPGLAGVAVTLYADSNGDGVPDGAAVATTSTDANGNYVFQNLDPDTYLVEIVPPAGYLGSTCSGLPYAASGTCEPAVDPDNDVDNDDNGTAAGATIRSGPVTLTVAGEPTNDGDGNNGNLSVDFGLLGNFDLALIKRLSAGQSGPFIVGQDVSFDITVFNQGAITATTILVNDYIPAGLALSPLETNWTTVSPTLVTRTLPGPLAPGASLITTILLRVTDASVSPLVNRAEIGSADDDGDPSNTPPTDIDSTPDGNPGNDGGGAPNTPSDDATGGNGSGTPGGTDPNGDEDDADPASIPVGSGGAVLGVAKAAQILGSTGGGGYGGGGAAPNADIAYIVLVRNYSTQAVNSLQVVENLVATFGSGANWSVTGLTSPTLSVNPAYDGRGATNLLTGSDTLAAGATATIRLTVNLQFEPGRRYTNQVLGTGLVGTAPVSDLSQNGTNPAPNGDPGTDNEGTVIQLGSTTIPTLSLPAILLLLAGLVLIVQQRRRLI